MLLRKQHSRAQMIVNLQALPCCSSRRQHPETRLRTALGASLAVRDRAARKLTGS